MRWHPGPSSALPSYPRRLEQAYSLLPETQGPGPVHSTLTLSGQSRPQTPEAEWRLGESGCHIRGLCDKAQAPLSTAAALGWPEGWRRHVQSTPHPSPKARWGLLQLRLSYRPLSDLPWTQGIPLAASQTLSLSRAFFPDKRPV